MTGQEKGDVGQLEESILSHSPWNHIGVPRKKMVKGKEMFNLRTCTSFQIYPSSHTTVPLNRAEDDKSGKVTCLLLRYLQMTAQARK